MNTLKQFLETNSFNFSDDGAPKINPGHELTILRLGLKNYYETYQADITHGQLSFLESNGKIIPFMECSHEYLARYYSAIGYVQLFLELYILAILEPISTFITRKNERINNFLQKLLENESDFSSKNTVGYSNLIERLKVLLDNNDNLPEEYKIPIKYGFLRNHIETLKVLANWRNKIMHSGKQVLHKYTLDFLFVNHLFPLVKKVIEIEDNTIFMNRNLYCGLNIIEEFNKLHLPDYNISEISEEDFDTISNRSNHVNHLKELGRASLVNPLFMGEFGTEDTQVNLEMTNKQKRRISEIEANLIHEPLNFHERFVCPCCGTKTLMTFEIWTETRGEIKRPYRAKCLLCSYSIHYSIGEPEDYGIMTEYIFNCLGEN